MPLILLALSASSEPLVPPIEASQVEQTQDDATQAAAGNHPDGWLPFPPTSPDVPAFSVPIVEVDPPQDPPAGYKGARQVAGVLLENPRILLVEIRVHSECAGGRDAALRSSESASDRIRSFLASQGVDGGRVRLVPMGCTSPVRLPEITPADRAANRRIEVEVIEVSN